jgi:hypothetical protein
VFEDNGFQGSRPEVLQPLSRASGNGKAASIFWNVNGLVVLTLAQRGKLLCEVELLDPDEDELEGMPKRLQKLLLTATDEGPVELGARLVEAFTGVGFTAADLEAAVSRPIEPVRSDRLTYTLDTSPLRYSDQELSEAIAALAPQVQRALAETLALAALREAGLADDEAIVRTTNLFGSEAAADLARATDGRLRELGRRATQARADQRQLEYDGIAGQRLTTWYAAQAEAAALALRAATHPDPFSAAVESVSAAQWTYLASRSERGVAFLDNAGGRWETTPEVDPSRAPQLDRVVRLLVGSDPAGWPDALATLPEPMSEDERREHERLDLERESAGEFQTWQYGPPEDDPPQTIVLSLPSQ